MRQQIFQRYTEVVAILLGEGLNGASIREFPKTLDNQEFEHHHDTIVLSWVLLIVVLTLNGFSESLQSWRGQEG